MPGDGDKKQKPRKRRVLGAASKKDELLQDPAPMPGPVKAAPQGQPKGKPKAGPQSQSNAKPKAGPQSQTKAKPNPKAAKDDARKKAAWANQLAGAAVDKSGGKGKPKGPKPKPKSATKPPPEEKGIFNGPGSSSSSSGLGASGGTSATLKEKQPKSKQWKGEVSSKGGKPPSFTETKGPKPKKPKKGMADQLGDNASVDVDLLSEHHEVYAQQIGDEEAHINFGHAELNVSSGLEITKDKIDANLISMDAKASLVHGEVNKSAEFMDGQAELGVHAEVDLLSAEAGLDVGATVDWEKGEAEVRAGGEVGAYLASAEGEVEGSYTIPYLGIKMGGHVGGEANIGVGAEANVEAGYSKDKGLHFGTKVGVSVGPGAKADVGVSVGLADEGLVPWVVEHAPEIAAEIDETADAVVDGAVEIAADLGQSALDVADDINEGIKDLSTGISNMFSGWGSSKKVAPKKKAASKKPAPKKPAPKKPAPKKAASKKPVPRKPGSKSKNRPSIGKYKGKR